MSRWFYNGDGQSCGPYTTSQLKELVDNGILAASDSVWPEAGTPGDSISISLALEKSFHSSTPSLPDWLADVAAQEISGPLSPLTGGNAIPFWLEDLRLWYQFEQPEPNASLQETTAQCESVSANKLPDWLSDVCSLYLENQAKKTEPQDTRGINKDTTPRHSSVNLSPNAEKPEKNAAIQDQKDTINQSASRVPQPPIAKRVDLPPPAKTIADESGFDPSTGQILDPEKFEKWKREKATSKTTTMPEYTSLMETFRHACNEISKAIDDDNIREVILQRNAAEIRRTREVDNIFQKYAGHGSVLNTKLSQYFEFMVLNRKQYYLARNTQN